MPRGATTQLYVIAGDETFGGVACACTFACACFCRFVTVRYLRTLLERRDHETMEKELMYSSEKLKNRVADLNDSVMFCMNEEAIKPAFMRKKVSQGRNSDSQS